MNSGAFNSSVGRCAFIGKFSVAVFALGLSPLQAMGASDPQFYNYVFNICNTPPSLITDAAKFNNVCAAYVGYSSGGAVNSVNVGMANAGSGTANRKKKNIRELQDEQKEKSDKGASADGRGWGFLVSPQYSNANRVETDFENGYKSKLAGLVVGLDYRYSDAFVLGATLGQTKDNATFLNSAGSLKTSNNTFNLYGTWLPSESIAIDGYLGYGKLNFDSNRHVEFGDPALLLISGTTSGSTSGKQVLVGMSASYQKDVGRISLSPFINLDYIKTNIKGYNESGNTALVDSIALHYSDRSTISFTSSLGARVSTSYGYDWGTFQPSVRLAAVHEFQNKSSQISNELVITPGTPFLVETDSPDRNYLNIGLGLSAAFNGGTQLFMDYDKRAQDKLLSSWAVSLGVLTEF